MAKNRPQQTAKKAHKKEFRRERRQKEKAMRVRQARRQRIFVIGAVVATIALAGFLLFQAADPTNQH